MVAPVLPDNVKVLLVPAQITLSPPLMLPATDGTLTVIVVAAVVAVVVQTPLVTTAR